jgi:hypothetical protein
MTKPEIAQIILECVDEAYPVPTYFEDDVREAIVKALVIIEREEAKADEEAKRIC